MSLALMPKNCLRLQTRENAGWGNHGKVYELLEGFDEHGVSRFGVRVINEPANC
jgi:hypothetical protein